LDVQTELKPGHAGRVS